MTYTTRCTCTYYIRHNLHLNIIQLISLFANSKLRFITITFDDYFTNSGDYDETEVFTIPVKGEINHCHADLMEAYMKYDQFCLSGPDEMVNVYLYISVLCI